MRSGRTLFRSALLGSTLALIAFTGAQAAGDTIVHQFAGPPNDGRYPLAPVTFDDSGNAYGTTEDGGAYTFSGTLYKLRADGTETILHSFGGAGDGASPSSAVTINRSTGDIYGTTDLGGASGKGTIWKYAANGTYSVLHSLDGTNDGNRPVGRLVRDSLGNLYGTAHFGGTNDDGTLFEYSAKGEFSVLHTFAGPDGQYPEGSLIRDTAGYLYGVTEVGGAQGVGSVYRIAPNGSLVTLYSFTPGAAGFEPMGGLARDNAGDLYGTTFAGGVGYGTVFKLSPDGSLRTLYTFTGGADGGDPEADILLDKRDLYGTTESGGSRTCGCGVVFKLPVHGSKTVLHAFKGSATDDGANSYAGVARKLGRLYGTTYGGGSRGYGVLFSVRRK